MKDKKGLFITFEGIDGCGKSTQIDLLKDWFEKRGDEVILTLEPGGSDLGKELRQILLHHKGFVDSTCELFLFLADRSQHVATVIKNNLQEGKVVLCDRFIDSTIAYQGFARGGDLDKLNRLNDTAIQGCYPDITFVLDLDVETAQKRVGSKKDRMEQEDLSFHKSVRQGYLALARINPKRIKVIDAAKPIEEVFSQIREIINNYYGK